MFKKLIFGAMLAAAVLCQAQTPAGGYQTIGLDDLKNLRADELFIKAELLAREAVSAQTNGMPGKIVGVSQQIVSGINYKMTFATPEGDYDVVVFCQPWTNTFEVTSVKPVTQTI